MLKTVIAKWNNKSSLEQIEQVEKRYHSLSRTTGKSKPELTSIFYFDSANNLKTNIQNIGCQILLQ